MVEDPGKKLTGRHVIIMMILIGAGGLVLRLSHTHAEIPLVFDSLLYFWYANDIALLDALPASYTPANNGWPIFLSLFFRLVDSGNYLDYMLVQRLVGAALSVLTVVPVYLICRRFFPAKFALIGPAIFVFEPRVAENSIHGLTEPLFVMVVATSVACFLSSRKRIVFIAFPLISLATAVRGEAIILAIPLVILYVARFRHSRRTAYEVPLLVLVIILILLPVITHRIEATGTDGIFVRVWDVAGSVVDGTGAARISDNADNPRGLSAKIANASLTSVPVIAFLIPYGLYRMLGRMETRGLTVMTMLAFMAVPSIYALTTAFAPRYLFWMIPILCIFCVFTVRRLGDLFSGRDVALVVITGLIIASSVIILEDKEIDLDHERDAIRIAGIVIERTEKINHYGLESGYIPSAVLDRLDRFPVLRDDVDPGEGGIRNCARVEQAECDSIRVAGGGIVDFLKGSGKENMTHLIVDDGEYRRTQFMIDVFRNEQEYPYLEKIYDSKDDGFEYHVKIFKINYEKFDLLYP